MAGVMSNDLVMKDMILIWRVRTPAGIAFPQLPEGVGTGARALYLVEVTDRLSVFTRYMYS
jgi:hypothetical protein